MLDILEYGEQLLEEGDYFEIKEHHFALEEYIENLKDSKASPKIIEKAEDLKDRLEDYCY